MQVGLDFKWHRQRIVSSCFIKLVIPKSIYIIRHKINSNPSWRWNGNAQRQSVFLNRLIRIVPWQISSWVYWKTCNAWRHKIYAASKTRERDTNRRDSRRCDKYRNSIISPFPLLSHFLITLFSVQIIMYQVTTLTPCFAPSSATVFELINKIVRCCDD